MERQAISRADRTHPDGGRALASGNAFVDNRPAAVTLRKMSDTMHDSPRMAAQRKLAEAMQNSPRVAAQRALSAAMSAKNAQSALSIRPTIQLMRIEALKLDTSDSSDDQIIAALKGIWSKMFGFGGRLSKAEAAHLYARLADADIDEEMLEDLKDAGDLSDKDESDDEEKPKAQSKDRKSNSESDDDDFGLMNFGRIDFGEMLGESAAAKPKVDKAALAGKIIALLRGPGGGLPVFLAGGGAVTLAGGPRAIKDLDLRIDLPPNRSFSTQDPLSNDLIEGINRLLTEAFDSVDPLERADADTGMTIAGNVEGVEVSITRTPAVNYMSHGADKSGVVRLGEFDLIFDKAYSMVMRRGGDLEKRVTDLIDLVSMIKKQPGLVNVLRGLNTQRGQAFATQSEKVNVRAKDQIFSDNLLQEFVYILGELRNTKWKEVQKLMEAYGAEDLIPLVDGLLEKAEQFLVEDKPVTVI